MLSYLVSHHLANHFELKEGQVTTLYALLEVPVMDYQIVETLHLYPRSKMRKNVLDPLRESGWISLHSLPPINNHAGAPRIAWSLKPERRAELQQAVNDAEAWAARQLRKSRDTGQRLSFDLFLDRPDQL